MEIQVKKVLGKLATIYKNDAILRNDKTLTRLLSLILTKPEYSMCLLGKYRYFER